MSRYSLLPYRSTSQSEELTPQSAKSSGDDGSRAIPPKVRLADMMMGGMGGDMFKIMLPFLPACVHGGLVVSLL